MVQRAPARHSVCIEVTGIQQQVRDSSASWCRSGGDWRGAFRRLRRRLRCGPDAPGRRTSSGCAPGDYHCTLHAHCGCGESIAVTIAAHPLPADLQACRGMPDAHDAQPCSSSNGAFAMPPMHLATHSCSALIVACNAQRGCLLLSALSASTSCMKTALAAFVRSSGICRSHRQLLTDLEPAGTDSGDAASAVWRELCGQNWRVRASLQVASCSHGGEGRCSCCRPSSHVHVRRHD